MSRLPEDGRRAGEIVFQPQDFDPDFDRDEHAATNLTKLFEDIVGCEAIVERLEGYQRLARVMKSRNTDARELIPTNFVFKGPPGMIFPRDYTRSNKQALLSFIGTGKTTIARKMGKVYYDMGLLNSNEIVECSASDLVGQYVGHTGPKTKKLLEKALGKVLFVDEAYRSNYYLNEKLMYLSNSIG